jgi:cyclase
MFDSPLLTRVIPCLDVKNGRVVKGEQFVDLVDSGDPVELASQYEAAGADVLVFLDITATNERRETVVDLVRRVSENVFIPFIVGGGIRSLEEAQAVLDCGADSVAVNSAALKRPELLSEIEDRIGSQSLVLAIDAKRSRDGKSWQVYSAGGREPSGREVVAWAKEGVERGIGEILLTSIDQDGRNDGYDIELLRAVADATNVPVIASGGAGKVEHFSQAILQGGAHAVLCASTLHRGELSIAEIKTHMADQGIPVRPIL